MQNSSESEHINFYELDETTVIAATRLHLDGKQEYGEPDRISLTVSAVEGIDDDDNDTLQLPLSVPAAREIFEYAKQMAAKYEDPDMVHMLTRKKIREVKAGLEEERARTDEIRNQAYRETLDASYQESYEGNGIKVEMKWIPNEKRISGGSYHLIFPQLQGKNSVILRKPEEQVDPIKARELMEVARLFIDSGWTDAQELCDKLRRIVSGRGMRKLEECYWENAEVNGIKLHLRWDGISFDQFIMDFPQVPNEIGGDPELIVLGKDKQTAKEAFALAKEMAKTSNSPKELFQRLKEHLKG